MELEEKERSSIPAVYEGPIVITAQPRGENNSSRRPIPISTTDWVSTPRSQLTALSGTHFLAGVEQLEIQRIINLIGSLQSRDFEDQTKKSNQNSLGTIPIESLENKYEVFGLSGNKKQYRVKIPKAETIFLAMESRADDKDILNRIANFTLILLDQAGETAFVIKKNPVWKYMPGPVHKMTIESTVLIGSIEQNFSILGPSFTVYDASRKPLCYIYGPNVSSCCMYKESQFQIISVDGSHQIASLMHQWNNMIHDYTFLLTFPLDLDIRLKSLLLGASFLMEHLYFENI